MKYTQEQYDSICREIKVWVGYAQVMEEAAEPARANAARLLDCLTRFCLEQEDAFGDLVVPIVREGKTAGRFRAQLGHPLPQDDAQLRQRLWDYLEKTAKECELDTANGGGR